MLGHKASQHILKSYNLTTCKFYSTMQDNSIKCEFNWKRFPKQDTKRCNHKKKTNPTTTELSLTE